MKKIIHSCATDEQGMSLLTAMIFMAVMGLVVVTVSTIVAQNDDTTEKFKVLDARNAVLAAALRNARTGPFYYSTLLALTPSPPTADPFYQCMLDDGAVDCQGGSSLPLTLIDGTDSSAPAIQVLGGNLNPVHYDLYGQVCVTLSRTLCLFDVSAEYTPHCPNNISPCKQAATITVMVSVRVNAAFQNEFSNLNALTAGETVPIGDFEHYFTPIFPIVVPPGAPGGQYGAPLGYGAGPTGGITLTWLIQNGATPPPPSSGPPPVASTSPAPSTCPPGSVRSAQGCVDFSF